MSGEVEFSITTRVQADGSTLVALTGELDLHRAPALAAALQEATGRTLVDLQDVTFLDSTTLALLVQEHRRLRSAGHELIVVVGEYTPTTVFAVTGFDRILTIRPAEQSKAEPSHSVNEAARRTAPVGAPLRVVIADDHEPTRVLLRTLLELEAIRVVGEAENGEAAITLALEQDPDVVLLDVNMPVLGGLIAAEIIRARRPQIRLLLHTGEPLETTLDRAAALDLPLADKRDLHITIQELAQQIEEPLGEDGAAATPELLVEVNARMRELADRDAGGDRWGFVCECGTPGCKEAVLLSASESEVVRAGGAAILAEGHTPTRTAAARARAEELRDDSAALRGEARHQARRAQRAVDAAAVRLALVCAGCGYGIAVDRPPERCPMCASAEWRPAGRGIRRLSES